MMETVMREARATVDGGQVESAVAIIDNVFSCVLRVLRVLGVFRVLHVFRVLGIVSVLSPVLKVAFRVVLIVLAGVLKSSAPEVVVVVGRNV